MGRAPHTERGLLLPSPKSPKREKRNSYFVNKENIESILFGTRSTNDKITTISQHILHGEIVSEVVSKYVTSTSQCFSSRFYKIQY